jgi:hypothetical protein
MTIQEILAAQNRAANLCKKDRAVPYSKQTPAKKASSVQDILAAQRGACAHKATTAPARPAATSSSVADIIEKQKATAAAQKGSVYLNASQKEIIEDVKKRYNAFLEKLDRELDGQTLMMPRPGENVAVEEKAPAAEKEPEQGVFVPAMPAGPTDVALEPVSPESPVNGISVGDEMGGQVAVTVHPRRRRKMRLGNGVPEGAQVR